MTIAQGISPVIYVLLGCPGAGKGTFAQAIKPTGYDHLSTGDLTRDEVKNGTPFGIKYQDSILNHKMNIPFEEIQLLIDQRMERALEQNRGIILDGYPKNVQQCQLLDAFIERKALKERVAIVLFEIDEEAAIQRIQHRQTCEKCNKIYNAQFSPPKCPDVCDLCQGAVKKRMDDNPEGTKKRVAEFQTRMAPVIDYYASSGRLTRIKSDKI